jgi:hypothetical protein
MRPTPEEVIASVRKLLKEAISPALPADAQSQLRRIMAVLRDCRWNEAGFDVLHENGTFTELARNCHVRLEQQAQLTDRSRAVLHQLQAAVHCDAPQSFMQANEINRQLRGALSGFIELVRDDAVAALDEVCEEIIAALLATRSRHRQGHGKPAYRGRDS